MVFIPAQNKLEAVTRIGRISGGAPEKLGPGSKEHKSVLINLYIRLGLDLDPDKSKQQLAKELVLKFNGTWDSSCESVGQTLTLIGLNKILGIAEARSIPPKLRLDAADLDLYEEVSAIEKAILQNLPGEFDGKACVTEMRESEDKNWRQTEWQGWYFEYLALPNLIENLGGGKRRLGSVTFDYQLNRTWDLKTHSSRLLSISTKLGIDVPLNDFSAMRTVISTEGLGLVILSGDAYLDKEFSIWHKSLRGKSGDPKRLLKSKFIPTSLDFFWFSNQDDLDAAEQDKILKPFKQGRQATGDVRKMKYMLDLPRAKSSKYLIKSRSL